MIPDSWLARTSIYTIAVLQTAVAPLSFVYFIYNIATESMLFKDHPTLNTYMHYWLGAELVFYVFFYITRNRMQRCLPSVTPSPKERRELFKVCLANVVDAKEWLRGWFMQGNNASCHPSFCEIYRENVAEWLAWAFFSAPLEDVLEDDSLRSELDWMINRFESMYDVVFAPGYNDDISTFRINLDPINAHHRPLVFYVLVIGLSWVFGLVLQCWGFKSYGPETRSTIWNLIELQQPYTSHKRTERISYWFRDGNRDLKPIIFIHGIGAGLMCYGRFLRMLMSLDAPIFCIELSFVAMRCVEDVPTMQETIRDFEKMLQHHGFENAIFVSHSLGTAVTAWTLKYLRERVAGVVFIDPICFMLHYKDLCVNFVYRIPTTASQSIIKYFASTELYISYYISRHFHWFQTALFLAPEDTAKSPITIHMPERTTVFLSEKDNIIDSSRVAAYLQEHQIKMTLMENLDHASFLINAGWERRIVETVGEYVRSNAN
ncbi:Alpha/Beta hydrolase protein [Radiomyces spectabilis]|uniref:Alpha/Beta hydrolase protein n=1 Tax=Radiomyces spectabilis TaxID=64574 RepID=UPI0022205164|nr:Alpha/Beta hydrolase protein [Radiomyces spectabilis]KAI8384936.1 Alpha/Beta hydrolase protein [Radiomyces spectabilis]